MANKRLRLAFRVAVVAALLMPRAFAGRIAPCSSASVYDNAAVNVVVLPFVYLASDSAQHPEAGAKLAALMQSDILFSILKYRSIGVVRLYGQGRECAPEQVIPKLRTASALDWSALARDAHAQMAGVGHHALVVVWGNIYQEGSDLFVQTNIQFLRRDLKDPGENIAFRLGTRYVTGRLSSQAFSFPPRRITTDDLARMESQYWKNAVLRKEPTETSQVVLRLEPTAGIPAQSWIVTGQQGAWMEIAAYANASNDLIAHGWLRGELNLGDRPLSSSLPELHFVEGVVGYLSARITAAESQDNPFSQCADCNKLADPKAVDAAIHALQASREATPGEGGDPTAEAVERQLEGILILMAKRAQNDPSGLVAAHQRFGDAFRLIPYSADAGNLELLSRVIPSFASNSRPVGQQEFANATWELCLLDPANLSALPNLAAFYQYSQRPDILARIPEEDRLTSPESLARIRSLMEQTSMSQAAALPKGDWVPKDIA